MSGRTEAGRRRRRRIWATALSLAAHLAIPLAIVVGARDEAPRIEPEPIVVSLVRPPPPPPPPPPPAPPPPPPPAPTAPPIPYEYLGKLADGHSVRVFLVRGERPYTVIEGDVLDGSYKVKSITDTTMTFVYLPLNITQTLPVGSKP